ncbi:MAG: right-handed parallel beta-helix repeat-containing protein [Lentisphaeria bacterium]|nr:right-handed parallel beta-helix repeat-containing protein [Lentisphaeria bacterium]
MSGSRAFLSILFGAVGAWAAAEADLLLHYPFDEGTGTVARDLSGHGLHATVGARWVESPAGGALLFDGDPAHMVSVQVPEDLRFGKGSWSFLAWIHPVELAIDDRQNQRRLFAFGVYPDAYLVIDLTHLGIVTCYFCYRDAAGTVVSTGASAGIPVQPGAWAHAALVCDRQAGAVSIYVNGYSQGPSPMRNGFDGDFSLGGGLTLGSAWHNYWGMMDEVMVYRRPLTKAEVKEAFRSKKEVFAVSESPEMLAAERRDTIAEIFRQAAQAWAEQAPVRARELYGTVVADRETPPNLRSYAHLRIAQSIAAENRQAEAARAYAAVAAETAYPHAHRSEAAECLREIERTQRGLPPRDPAASRTPIPRLDTFAAEIHLAEDGNDATGDGSREKPFATLPRARDAVRDLKARALRGPIAVTVAPGRYPVTGPFELTAEDSGNEDAPIVYRAAEMGEAVFYGGAALTGFVPVSDPAVLERLPESARSRVMQCDLRRLGIEDYGELRLRGFGQPPPPPTLELFLDGRPMTLARWPNEGFVGSRSLVDPGSPAEGRPAILEYDSDRHARWTRAEDLWLFGYFRYLWADAAIRIAAIDTETRTLTTAEPYRYGGGMSTQQGIQYYAFNLLEEIDAPGEWYLDRRRGILYLYPPASLAEATVEIGMLPQTMVTMTAVSDVRIEGLTFDLARYNGLELTDCTRCVVAGCTVSRMAGNGITIRGGTRNGLLGCDVHTIGRRATEVIGGDRASLTPGEHFVENCRIHFFGRIDRTYTPAVQLEGVGNRVAHNLMYNCPSSVMRIEGNDHIIEFNDVHSAVRESDDQGAMELFRNATYRGVVFRHNRFLNVGKTGSEAAVHGQAGIRLDDAISGILIYGNLFVRSANGRFGAIQMNSGRDNVIDNNLFVDCKQGISGGWNPGNSVWRMLREGSKPADFHTGELHLERYPELAHMLEEPGINHLWRNVFYRCGPIATGNRAYLDLMENAVFEEQNPGFVDPDRNDFRLRPDAPLQATVGFRPIPLEMIGLYEDTYRASWPVHTTPVTMPDWRPGAP